MSEEQRFLICGIIAFIFWGAIVLLLFLNPKLFVTLIVISISLFLGGILVLLTAVGLMEFWETFK